MTIINEENIVAIIPSGYSMTYTKNTANPKTVNDCAIY